MDEKNQTGSTESKESEEHVKQDYLAPEHDGASEDIEEEAALERERQRLREERRERRRQKEAAQKAAQRRKLFLFLLLLCTLLFGIFLFIRKGKPALEQEEKASASMLERAPIEL